LGVALVLILNAQMPPGLLLARKLGRWHEIETVSTATDALRAVKRLAPAAVFVGLRKPGPEGWKFLRERRVRGISVPTVVYSDDPAIAVWARRAAASAFLLVSASPGKQVTVNEAATRLGLTPDAIRRRIREGTLLASAPPGSAVGYRIEECRLSSIRPSSKVAKRNRAKSQPTTTTSVIPRIPLFGLWYVRQQQRLSQAELAVRAGMRQHAISDLERCKNVPRAATVRRLAAALGVDPQRLVEPPDS